MDQFVDVVVHSRGMLLQFARHRLRNPEWAQDAVSETVLAAFEHRPDIDEAKRIRSWLFGVLRHKIVDQLRRQIGEHAPLLVGGLGEVDLLLCPEHNAQDDPAAQLAAAQTLLAISAALDMVPERCAQAFLYCDVLGHDTSVASEALGVTRDNLYVMRHRARRLMQAQLNSHST